MAFITLPLGDVNLKIEIEQEEDGRFIAEVIDFPGVLAYRNTRQEAVAKVQALALRVLADQLVHENFLVRNLLLIFSFLFFL
jgi:predicted RNase H-like HicB family nuclease